MTTVQAVLSAQLEISWSLAARYYLPALTDEIVFWAPSDQVCGLIERDGRWFGQWPDEETDTSDATVGWLLWHIEWWWTDAIRGVEGQPRSNPLDAAWSGSTAASISTITALHDTWAALIETIDLDHICVGPWPTPQPFSTIAGWVNLELMKNVAEIGQLIRLHENKPVVRLDDTQSKETLPDAVG